MMFTSWQGLLRVVVAGILGYVALVVLLRASGKRTLSKMNAFDLVVTVALGSSLATVLLSKQVAVLEAVVGFAVLIGLQFAVAWLSVRSKRVERLVKSQPALVFYRGQFLEEALRRERLTESAVRAAMREQGVAALEDVAAVVLETAGELSVMRTAGPNAGALVDVAGIGAAKRASPAP